MKQIDTGSAPGDRLLNTLVSYIRAVRPHLFDDWCSGDIEMDFDYRFLETKSGIDYRDVPTVLARLNDAGYIRARFDMRMNCARISLRLVAGAQAA